MKRKGFTLIELMVVIGIVTIMSAILLASIVNNRDRRLVKTSAETFISDLRGLQNKALTGELIGGLRPCFFDFSPTVSGSRALGYSISSRAYDPGITDGSGDYYSCANLPGGSVPIKNVSFQDGVEMRVDSTTPVAVSFVLPFADIVQGFENVGSDPSVSFILEKGSDQYRICLYRSGRIEAVGFGTTTCN